MSGYTSEGISQIAKEINEIHGQAYQLYFPLTEDICSRTATEDEVEHLLDCLLDFGPDEKILGLYKQVCRKYVFLYSAWIKFYIETYREMWECEETEKPNIRKGYQY